MGHHGFNVLKTHLLLDGPLHADQTDPVLVFDQFSDGTHPAVAKMIDIVHAAIRRAVFQVDQILDRRQDVLIAQNGDGCRHIETKLVIHLRPSYIGEIIALRFKEEAVEKFMGGLRRGRIAGSQSPVNFNNRVFRRLDPIHQQRVPDRGIFPIFIDVDELEGRYLPVPEKLQPFCRQFLVAPDQYLAGIEIEHV